MSLRFSDKVVHKKAESGRAGRRSLTVPELHIAKAARLAKVTPSYLSRVVNGRQTPGLVVAGRIAKVLGVTIEQVMGMRRAEPKAVSKVGRQKRKAA